MTLAFTLSAGIMLQEEGREGARQLLIATIGCNIAWGIIDGALYMVGQLFERGRRGRVMQLVHEAKVNGDTVALAAAELDELVAGVTTADERQGLYRRIVDQVRTGVIPPNRITREDFFGAIASFWLVFLASLPAAVPFLFIDEAWVALRVSNAILLALLFYLGYAWARHTMAKPLLAGFVFLIGGVGRNRDLGWRVTCPSRDSPISRAAAFETDSRQTAYEEQSCNARNSQPQCWLE